MYEILAKDACIWWRIKDGSDTLICLGPAKDAEAMMDAMVDFIDLGGPDRSRG
jgi:hypothetical protein